MSNKRKLKTAVPLEKSVKPRMEPADLLPLDVWSIIMRFSEVSLLCVYTLLSKRYKECVYSLSMEVLCNWIAKSMEKKSTGYRFVEKLGPEQLFYNVKTPNENKIVVRGFRCTMQLVDKNRVLDIPIAIFREELERAQSEDRSLLLQFVAYRELLRNTNKNSRLSSVVANSVAIHCPYLLCLYPEVETLALSLYTKDEILLGVYGVIVNSRLTFLHACRDRKLFRDIYYKDDDRKWCGSPTKFTFQDRTCVRVCVFRKRGCSCYLWCESTYIESLSMGEPTAKVKSDSWETVCTMISLSRLKPRINHPPVCLSVP